ncbi:MAG: pyridoxal 5'-phosphate synthase glutaminase subunit PdxT [Chloroflexi bacterium]|nr:pyridoxal 5'-phosphate synthase glutaminase subunit PdxT [Chloroflexota bacterium]
MRIGVLAAQGAFLEHIAVLRELGVNTVPVRLPYQLDALDGLIIPGGESTSIRRLMLDYDLMERIKARARKGLPVWGTCAGMILLAKELSEPDETLAVMDIKVKRNAFGRQKDSFETRLLISALGEDPFPAIFIRAPIIEKVGDKVDVLARLEDETIVAARQKNLLACAFHPELTKDTRFHRYFLDIVAGSG